MDEEGRRHIFLRTFWLYIWEALNNKKNSFSGTQHIGYTYLWALNDGISIENWFISRAAGSKLNLYSNPSETRHFIQSQKRVKWLRQLIKKNFQHKPSVISVTFQWFFTLDCNNVKREYDINQELGLYSSPLCFTLLRSLYFPERSTLTSQYLQVRWADGKYGRFEFRKPIWLAGRE